LPDADVAVEAFSSVETVIDILGATVLAAKCKYPSWHWSPIALETY